MTLRNAFIAECDTCHFIDEQTSDQSLSKTAVIARWRHLGWVFVVKEGKIWAWCPSCCTSDAQEAGR